VGRVFLPRLVRVASAAFLPSARREVRGEEAAAVAERRDLAALHADWQSLLMVAWLGFRCCCWVAASIDVI
jgi:hypothetical protein